MDKLDEKLNSIKNKANNIEIDDEVKNRIKKAMLDEYNRLKEEKNNSNTINENSENEVKKNKIAFLPQKIAAACACFVIISGCVFADGITNWTKKIFSNVDKDLDVAIENGNYKEYNMDYIENDGVGIKVDYIVQDGKNLYIAFNVKSEDEIDEVYFDDIKIYNKNEEKISITMKDDITYVRNKKNVNPQNSIIIYKIENDFFDRNYNCLSKVSICEVKTVYSDKEIKNINGEYNFILNSKDPLF